MSGWRLERGARPEGQATRFEVWAPSSEGVSVRLLTGAAAGLHPLEAAGEGVFAGRVEGAREGDDYRYALASGVELADPVSRWQPEGVHGPSRILDPERFAWSDQGWRGLAAADLVVYEVHVGTFTPAGTFASATAELPRLVDLGVTAVELMPVAEFPGGRNWGYDGVFPYAAQSTYGGPAGLRAFVDAAHAHGLAVVLDVVYNHLGPEGNVVERYGPYFTDRYRTPWGRAVNYDGGGSDEVRRYVIDNALHWIVEHHVDALRLDAVHAIYDFGARHVLEEIGAAVHGIGAELGRRALVIAESDLNDPRLLRPPERGGYGLDAQWSDDFHHAVHVALTGERGGYYDDFGGVEPLATALRERFVYAGRRSRHRGRRHGAPAADVPADRFVVAVQNHDQVGNRARGERLTSLVPFEARKLAAALLLLSPYVPLLFMGEEYGETNPFLYFVSHGDPDLVRAVREGREREFAAFAWQGEIPDPQAEETFRRSRIDPARARLPGHAETLRLHRDLLALRRREPALRPGDAEVEVAFDGTAGVALALTPRAGGRRLLALFNVGPEPRVVAAPPEAASRRWRQVLTSADTRYGGTAEAAGDGALARPIPGHAARLLAEEGA